MARGRNRLALLLGVLMLAALACAGPAAAQGGLEISEFETTSSSSEAGAHPDLRDEVQAAQRRRPRNRPERHLRTAQGDVREPERDDPVHVRRLLPRPVPTRGAQAGVIVVHANYEGESQLPAGHGADLQRRPRRRRGCPLRLRRARPSNIPIAIPVNVLSADDYRLRFTVSGITQLAPLAAADLDFWGFPAAESHPARTLPERLAGEPARLPG